MNFQKILTIENDPLSLNLATVLETLLGIPKQSIDPQSSEKFLQSSKHTLIIFSETQLNHLVALRLKGFRGAVLILALDSFSTLKEKHRILRWGQGSHNSCQPPWLLSDILTQIAELVPLEPENLRMLQHEITAPKRWLQKQIIPTLKRLLKHPEEIEQIALVINQIRADTPVACHAIIEIEGHHAQIQQHFQRLINQLSSTSPTKQDTINKLKQVFEQWHNTVLAVGEGLGAFS